MKDPYAPGFWCSVTILGTLTASYFYGIRQTQQMNQAVHFLYAAAAVTVAVALVALTWIAWQQFLHYAMPLQPDMALLLRKRLLDCYIVFR